MYFMYFSQCSKTLKVTVFFTGQRKVSETCIIYKTYNISQYNIRRHLNQILVDIWHSEVIFSPGQTIITASNVVFKQERLVLGLFFMYQHFTLKVCHSSQL